MIECNHGKSSWGSGVIKPPAYPFTAQDLYADLRARLEAETGEELSFKRLGQIIGRSKSTAHQWFSISGQAQFIAWLCLMERLSTKARISFIETHCRVFPSLEHALLIHAPSKVGKLHELLRQKTGLSILCGGDDRMRVFVATAMGHAYRDAAGHLGSPVGIDVNCPFEFVPLESLAYIRNTLPPFEIKRLLLNAWPRIQTSSGKLIILNGVWNRMTEIREEILRCAKRNHVLLAEAGTPDLAFVRVRVSTPLHSITLSTSKRIPNGINLSCRQIKPLKRLKKPVLI
jgi:hypothetical protein